MPNLRGASPVGRGVGGRAYAARAISRGKPNRRNQGRGRIPSTTRVDSNLGRDAVGLQLRNGAWYPRSTGKFTSARDGRWKHESDGLTGSRGGGGGFPVRR